MKISRFRQTIPIFIAAGFALSLPAQPPAAFEVASIRPAVNDTRGTSFDMFEGGRLSVTSVTLYGLIKSAWMLQDSQVAGPGWLDSDRYDIEAKSGHPERIDTDHLQPLLQNLLADRFALKFHWDAPMTILNTHKKPGALRIAGTRVTMEDRNSVVW